MVGTSNQSVPKMAIALLKNGSVIWHPNTHQFTEFHQVTADTLGPLGSPKAPGQPQRVLQEATPFGLHTLRHTPGCHGDLMKKWMDQWISIDIQLIWELKISGISTLVQSIFVWKPCFYTTFVQIHAHTIFFSQGCGVWFSQKEASTCLMHKSSVKARMSDAENTWSHWPRHHAGAVNTIFEIPPDNAVQRSINGWKIAGYSPTI